MVSCHERTSMPDRRFTSADTGRPAPGPNGFQLLKIVPQLLVDPLQFFSQVVRTYGDVVCFRFRGKQLIVLNHPAYIQHVLKTHQTNYRRGEVLTALHPLLGNGLFTSNEEFWRHQRLLMKPAFSSQHIEQSASVMTEAVAEMFRNWHPLAARETPLDIELEMKRLTLKILWNTLLSPDRAVEVEAVVHALNTVLEAASLRNHAVRLAWSFVLHPLGVSLPENKKVPQSLRFLDGVVYQTIQACRDHRSTAGPLLSILLQAAEQQEISDRQIRDEVMSIVFAGYDTVAEALTWTWYVLAHHPDIEQRLHHELQTVLRGRPPMMSDLPRLPYTRMVIQETLRLYPPAWAFHRMANEDDTIGGYAIPKDSYIMICPYTLHRHPQFWDNPDMVQPERFQADQSTTPVRDDYLPFGGGPHLCIGHRFAMVEAQLVLAMIAQKYRLSRITTTRMRPADTIILRSRKPLYMIPHQRSSLPHPDHVTALS